MKRKLQFDMPKLKIGSSRVDLTTSQDRPHPDGLDSPPVTPKSVRPPLPPDVDAELRKACAIVLHNFKPSSQLFDEESAKDHNDEQSRQRLDYAAIRKAVREELDASIPPVHKTHKVVHSKPFKVEGESLDDLDPAKFRYKPRIATEDLFNQDDYSGLHLQRRAVTQRADLLMSNSLEQPTVSANSATRSHAQTVSLPLRASSIAPNPEPRQRPRPAMRTDSNDTSGSTPRTDTTDCPWETSTAPTSVLATPARSSKRASSQALHFGSEAHGAARIDATDAEWMRLELEKHKKAQEEMKIQQEPQAGPSATTSIDKSAGKPSQAHSAARQMPIRRPPVVPQANSDHKRRSIHQRVDSSQSQEDAVARRRLSAVARTESQQETESSRRQSSYKSEQSQIDRHQDDNILAARRAQEDIARPESRSRGFSQGVKNYFRPSTAQASARQSADLPRPESRSRSITRQVQDYVRPASRNASVDKHRGLSRQQSVESISNSSHTVAGSSTHQWKSWKPWGRGRNGSVSSDSNRPESSGSSTRGRQTDRELRPSQSTQNVKRAVDLNRELPPLPGLDQWKEPEPRVEHESEQSTRFASKAPHGERARGLRPDGNAAKAPAARPRIVSLKNSQASVPAALSSATLTGPPDLNLQVKDLVTIETVDVEPSPVSPTSIESMRERRKSHSLLDAYLDGQGQTATGKPITVAKAQLVDNARVVGSRPARKPGHKAYPQASIGSVSTYATPIGHSRTHSENPVSTDNFGEPHVDDYNRMHDPRYQNVTEVPAIDATNANMNGQSLSSTPNSRTSKKWWQRNKREKDWMETVVKSGSHSGLIVTDDVASAPIVRY